MTAFTGSRSHAVESRSSRRVSTETKAGPKTTEFVLTVAIVGVLVAATIIKKGNGANDADQFIARQA